MPVITRRAQLGTDDQSLEEQGRTAAKTGGDDLDGEEPLCLKRPAAKRAATSTQEEEHEEKPKKQRRGAAKDLEAVPSKSTPKAEANSKAKAKAAPKQKGRAPKAKTSPKSAPVKPKGKNAEPAEKPKKWKTQASEDVMELEVPHIRTWAGRWVPADNGLPRTKMMAIKHVFDEFVAPKVSSPSTLSSPFYKLCVNAFRAGNIDKVETPESEFVACAELQVSTFLLDENTRDLSIHSFRACFCVCVCFSFCEWGSLESPVLPRQEVESSSESVK